MLDRQQLERWRQDIVFEAVLGGQPFTFHSTWGIFSPRQIDEGTQLLIEQMSLRETDDCFDLGCGYGPLGLYMARLAPKGQTLMVDKDFMAVEYSNKNARLNGLGNARAQLSNGFAHIEKTAHFDVIASNIPAKVGGEMMSILLHDAKTHLKPGGKLYVVTINGLRQYMKRNMEEIFGNYDKLKQGRTYTAALAVKTA